MKYNTSPQVKEFLARPEAFAYPKIALVRAFRVMSTALDKMNVGETSFEFLHDLDQRFLH